MNYSNCDLRLSPARTRGKPAHPAAFPMAKSADRAAQSAGKAPARRHRMPKGFLISAFSLLAIFSSLASSKGVQANWSTPTGDRWLYPNGSDLGSRTASPLFGDLGDAGSDEKIGTLLTIFNTAGLVTPGLGASTYLVSQVTLSLTVSGNAGSANYDGTYDSYRSFLPSADPNYLADTDSGRPVELYGAGFRNGYTAATYAENSPYGPGGASDKGTRNVYPLYYNGANVATDASNNVSAGTETAPFAIGQTGLAAGSVVPVDTVFTFTLDLTNPLILAYVQSALNAGLLDFVFTSLAAATQPGNPGQNAYLSFYNKENNIDGAPAALAVTYTLVPEPGSAWLLVFAGAAMALRRRVFAR